MAEQDGLTRAVELFGKRWSLLIVGRLLANDGFRYTDLHKTLPNIATNLLALRLRELEQAGVVRREVLSPPLATTVFRLTNRGMQLKPAIRALERWGSRMQ